MPIKTIIKFILFYVVHTTLIFENNGTLFASSFVIQSPTPIYESIKINQYRSQQANKNGASTFTSLPRRTSRKRHFSHLYSTLSSSSSFKVLFQKVVRPPRQLLATTKIKKNKSSEQNKLIIFLPSLIHYLQSTYTLPQNLPITYDTTVPSDDDETDCDTDTYSILEIKSPLACKDDYRFHLYVEVIGLYTSTENNKGNDVDSNSNIPSMAMVVIKTKQWSQNENSNNLNSSRGNDIMRQRLFQDSIDKIIHSIDVGLDSYTFGDVPLMAMDLDSNNNYNNIADDGRNNYNDESWIGLDEYEGLNTNDSWEDLESVLSSRDSQNRMSWDKDVVIDTVATTSNDSSGIPTSSSNDIDIVDKIDHNTDNIQSKINISDTKNSLTTNTDFAVQAAQEAMEKRRNNDEKNQRKHGSSSDSNDGGGEFAVELAKKVATKKKENALIDDYAVASAKKIAKSDQWDKVSSTRSASKKTVGSTTPKSNDPMFLESQVGHGGNTNLEDMLPQISPMVKKGMGHHYTKPDAFRISISDPNKFSAKKNKRKIVKGTKVEKKRNEEKSVDKIEQVKNSSLDEHHTISENDHNQAQRLLNDKKELNIVTDDTSLDPRELNDKERQKIMNNLIFQTPKQTTPPPSPTKETSQKSFPRGKTIKTQEEIEQDIYKAALDIMPGNNVDVDGMSKESNDMTAEELLKDVLKFGEEKQAEETDGAGFAGGALNKAKELMSLEQNEQIQREKQSQLDYGYKSENSPSSEEEELRQIFAAGQDIAEGRISLSTSSKESMQMTSQSNDVVTDQYVDELIDADKTVPRNARSLDDELAELELRIGRSPSEELDQGDNALFDIFTGPEVFNPNVDPESAVNWPGALPGTRTDIKLPPELEIAMKNAQFAAKILSSVVEEDGNFNFDTADKENRKKFFVDGKEINQDQIRKLQACVEEGIAVGLIENPFDYLRDKSRLEMVINEMRQQPDERFGEIIVNYKDLLLSDNFSLLLKEKLRTFARVEKESRDEEGRTLKSIEDWHLREREIMGKMVQYAQVLLKEARALGAELEASQLEIIRSICKVAMDPTHETEEETAIALTDAVREMKPLLDENFVAYLKYAIGEEEGRLARAGVLDDPEHNRWLFVLKIVQEGVYSELSKGVQRYIDHISYVLRMETKVERRMLVSKLIDAMPSMDIRPFVKVVDNIAASLGSETRGDFDDATLGAETNKILQLRRDVHDLLPSDKIKELSKDADDWAARQKEKLLEQRGISQQRLKASKDSQEFDEVIQRGEIERFD